MDSNRLLICVDYGPLRHALVQAVSSAGFKTQKVGSLGDAIAASKQEKYNMAVVGLLQEPLDQTEVIRRLKEAMPEASLLMLRCRSVGMEGDVSCIQSSVREVLGAGLLVRLLGVLQEPTAVKDIRVGDLELKPASCQATVDGIDPGLTACEYRLLEHLVRRRGDVVSPRDLLRLTSGSQATSNVVAQLMSRVRSKIRACGGGDPIETRRGLGYVFAVD